MAFEKITRTSSGALKNGCAVGVVKNGRGYSTVKYRIGVKALEDLRWTPETRVSLSWGTGDDAGKVLIASDPKGITTTWPGRARSAYITSPRLPEGVVLKEHPTTEVDFDITSEGLILHLPPFLLPAD